MRKLLVLMMTVTACGSERRAPPPPAQSGEWQHASTVAGCVADGVAYFKEIGSYPTLSDGRNAEEVASERCQRTLTAFPKQGTY